MLLWFPVSPLAMIELFASATPQVWMLSKKGWIVSKNFVAQFEGERIHHRGAARRSFRLSLRRGLQLKSSSKRGLCGATAQRPTNGELRIPNRGVPRYPVVKPPPRPPLHGCSSKILLRVFSHVPQLPDPGDELQAEFSFVDGRRSSLVRRSTGFYRSYIRRGRKDRRLDEMANGPASRNASDSQPIFSGLLLH